MLCIFFPSEKYLKADSFYLFFISFKTSGGLHRFFIFLLENALGCSRCSNFMGRVMYEVRVYKERVTEICDTFGLKLCQCHLKDQRTLKKCVQALPNHYNVT